MGGWVALLYSRNKKNIRKQPKKKILISQSQEKKKKKGPHQVGGGPSRKASWRRWCVNHTRRKGMAGRWNRLEGGEQREAEERKEW